MRLPPLSFVLIYGLALLVGTTAATSIDAPCSKPRIRKEWRSLTRRERVTFLEANNCLAALPHSSALVPTHLSDHTGLVPPVNVSSSLYDDLVFTHIEATVPYHGTGVFLPWHRFFIWTFETYIRRECGYKGPFPYWDFTLDYKDLENSNLFDADPLSGIGERGRPENNYTLTNGAFAGVIRAYPTPHLIQRIFRLTPYDTGTNPFGDPYPFPNMQVNQTLTTAEYKRIVRGPRGDFVRFQGDMEGPGVQGMHTSVHRAVGGDAASNAPAPNDVMFWLLHTGLDRVWAAWQAEHRSNLWAIGGGTRGSGSSEEYIKNPAGIGPPVTLDTVLVMSGMAPEITVRDSILTDGRLFCYWYDRLSPAGV